MTLYDELVARGLIAQVTDEEEIKEIMREAIFQEPDVSRIDSMTVSYDGRSVSVAFTATLVNKETITLEVTA